MLNKPMKDYHTLHEDTLITQANAREKPRLCFFIFAIFSHSISQEEGQHFLEGISACCISISCMIGFVIGKEIPLKNFHFGILKRTYFWEYSTDKNHHTPP
ncbi:MAG: hypothetical protein DYG96_11050 [Chlorobi bacterium CHB2]|nr:hypothetical protein [Chlorobi bacterium CHB2]